MSTYVHGLSENHKLRIEVDRLRRENQELARRAQTGALDLTAKQIMPMIVSQFEELHQIRGKRIKSGRYRKQVAMAHRAALREEDARKGAYRMRIILEEIDAYNQEKKAS